MQLHFCTFKSPVHFTMAMSARIRRPRPKYYKIYRRHGHTHTCHPSAVRQWSAIDTCGDADHTFINEPLSTSFKCAICMDIITNPVNISCGGGHIFCKKCIQQTARSLGRRNPRRGSRSVPPVIPCPSCREPFAISDIRIDNFVKRMIGDLMIKCPNHQVTDKTRTLFQSRLPRARAVRARGEPLGRARSRSRSRSRSRERNDNQNANHNEQKEEHKQDEPTVCTWSGEYRNLKQHLAVCQLSIVPCKRCALPLQRRECARHELVCPWLPRECARCNRNFVQCEQHLCPNEVIDCQFGCEMRYQRMNKKEHKQTCSKVVIQCVFAEYGCDVSVPRENMPTHLEQCQSTHLSLMKDTCDEFKELESNYNELHGKYDALQENYEELNGKYDDLEGEHQELQDNHGTLEDQHESLEESHEELETRVGKMEEMMVYLLRARSARGSSH
eukprot:389477_1